MNRSIDELTDFNDKDLLTLLKDEWDIDPRKKIDVIGELKWFVGKNDRPFVVLKNIRSLAGDELEYPIRDLDYRVLLN